MEYYINGNIYNKGKTTGLEGDNTSSVAFKSSNENENNIYKGVSEKGLMTIWERN